GQDPLIENKVKHISIVHRHYHFRRRDDSRRVYVERSKLLEQYTNEELYARFRFGNADIKYIADLVRPELQRRTRRSHSMSVEEQVLIALIGVDKSTVSKVVKAVSVTLASLVNQFVCFPRDDQISQTNRKFLLLGNMPNTIGVIDCTHVCIQAPHEREWEYINRKGRHSINIQLVGDADLLITNCVVKWPGSVHDARILRESALYRKLQTNRPDGIILGDSAYPLLPRLMTPFLAPNTPEQARFNTAHSKTRCAIERLNGVLKRRFACLNYLRVEPQGGNIILACIVLHNIATKRNVPLCDEVNDAPAEPAENEDIPPTCSQNERVTEKNTKHKHKYKQ
uniref:DDE Tnp4 domain-containing protein n=1 Tax=Gouania willdenowi TaxID=441366 RepID=A0A8C5DLQ8_GOUWI